MNYLVDTHVFLWIILSPKKISQRTRKILLDPSMTKKVSIITFWEISLKFSLGKIDLRDVSPDKLPFIAKETGFEILNLNLDTASTFHKLSKKDHRDPFDRMLIWQAIREDCVLITQDKDFSSYKNEGLSIIW